jgi:hypothetical protein
VLLPEKVLNSMACARPSNLALAMPLDRSTYGDVIRRKGNIVSSFFHFCGRTFSFCHERIYSIVSHH